MALFDAHSNLAISAAVNAPGLAGTTLTVAAGDGPLFPAVPFNCTLWPAASVPVPSNAEIVRVTAISGDDFTIVRAQEGTTAKSITAGFQIANTATKKTFTDIENAFGFPGTQYGIPYFATVEQLASTGAGTAAQFLRGNASGAPSFSAIADGDLPSALTGKTYNGLTLAAAATGFTIAGGTTSKTLTVDADLTTSAIPTGNVVYSGTQFGLPYFATTSTLGSTAAGTTNQVLIGAVAGAPSFTGSPSITAITLSSLTAGRVAIVGTAGLVTDSASLLFSSTSLTVGAAVLNGAAATTLTGGGGNMTITAGTGVSRSLTLQTTSGASAAQTNLTLNADLTSTFASGVTIETGNLTFTGSQTIYSTGTLHLSPAAGQVAQLSGVGFVVNYAAAYIQVVDTNASSSTSGGYITLQSTDGAAMAAGDRLGSVRFGGSYGASSVAVESVSGYAESLWVDGVSYPTFLKFLTVPSGSTGSVERWRITSAGVFQAADAQLITTAVGALTLAPVSGSNLNLTVAGGATVNITGTATLSSLTATRVTFAGASGLLADDADMTFVTDTLSVTKLLAPTSVSTPSLISTTALTITPAAGSNLNVSLSTTGDFAVNTNQLYVDTSAAKVGIGIAVPTAKLSVHGVADEANVPILKIVDTVGNHLGMLSLKQDSDAYGFDLGLDSSTGDGVWRRISNSVYTEAFRIKRDSAVLSFPGAYTLTTATGAMTIATGAANGDIYALMHGTGKFGVGVSTLLARMHVYESGTALSSASSDAAKAMIVEGPNYAFSATTASLTVVANDTVGANIGGGIGFGAKYTGNSWACMAAIKSGKDNATSGETGGYMSLGTRANGGVIVEALRLASTGIATFAAAIINSSVMRLKGYTVAGLPAGTTGDSAYATDLLTPTFFAAAVGGGAVVGPVFYNGSAWICT